MSQRTNGSGLWLDSRDAVLLSSLCKDEVARRRRNGWVLSVDDARTIESIDLLARAYRASVNAKASASDPIGPIGATPIGHRATMSVAAAAGRLDCTDRHVTRLINNDKDPLPARKIKGRWAIDPADLNDYIERQSNA